MEIGKSGNKNDAKYPRVGVGVFVVRGEKILVGLRKGSHGEGTWALPGGHLEFGELVADCARREVFEETGISLDTFIAGPYTEDYFKEEGKHYVTLFVVAEFPVNAVEPIVSEPNKLVRWEWRRWNNLPKPLFLPLIHLREMNFNPITKQRAKNKK